MNAAAATTARQPRSSRSRLRQRSPSKLQTTLPSAMMITTKHGTVIVPSGFFKAGVEGWPRSCVHHQGRLRAGAPDVPLAAAEHLMERASAGRPRSARREALKGGFSHFASADGHSNYASSHRLSTKTFVRELCGAGPENYERIT